VKFLAKNSVCGGGEYLQYPEVPQVLEVRLEDKCQVVALEIPEKRDG
jgi:hypothetical protein